MTKVRKVLKGLSESTDLGKVLEGEGVSAERALRLLEGEEGKRELEARRKLARLHVELLAQRYSALAMVKLCGLLDEKEKLEVRLKAAMAVLGAVGNNEELRNKGTDELREEEGDGEVLRAVAEVMEERRRGEMVT